MFVGSLGLEYIGSYVQYDIARHPILGYQIYGKKGKYILSSMTI